MIDFSITTSRRPDLLVRTINSLALQCKDLHLVQKVILIDDGSTDDDVQFFAGGLQGLFKKPVECSHSEAPLGRTAGMRRWFDLVSAGYCFHIEDDWEFIRPFRLASIVDFLARAPMIGQVALSRSGLVEGSASHPGQPDYWVWHKPWRYPHYTSNPHVVKMAAIRQVGNFEPAATALDVQPTDEFCYGLRWMHYGWKTAYTYDQIARHIGQGRSAYALNGTKR